MYRLTSNLQPHIVWYLENFVLILLSYKLNRVLCYWIKVINQNSFKISNLLYETGLKLHIINIILFPWISFVSKTLDELAYTCLNISKTSVSIILLILKHLLKIDCTFSFHNHGLTPLMRISLLLSV